MAQVVKDGRAFWKDDEDVRAEALGAPSGGEEAAEAPSFWSAAAHTLGVGVLSTPLGVISGVAIARALGPEGKGIYNLVFATSGLLSMALGVMAPMGVTYAVARLRPNLRALTSRLLVIGAVIGVVASGVLYLVSKTPLSQALLPGGSGPWAVAAISSAAALTTLAGYWRAFLVGRQRIVVANTRDLAGTVVHVALVVGAATLVALGWRLTAEVFVAATLAASGFTAAMLARAIWPLMDGRGGPSGVREAFAYSIPCYLGRGTQFLNYRLDIFMVSFLLGLGAVGVYTLAVSVAQLLWLVSQAAATVLFPRVAAAPHTVRENASLAAQITRLAFWFCAIAASVLGIVGYKAVPLIYGEAFRQSTEPLLWLLPGVLAFTPVTVLSAYIRGVGKPHLNLSVSLMALTVTIALDVVLIPRMGVVGAAIASSASYTFSAVATVAIFARLSSTKVLSVFLLTRNDIRLVLGWLRSSLTSARLWQPNRA